MGSKLIAQTYELFITFKINTMLINDAASKSMVSILNHDHVKKYKPFTTAYSKSMIMKKIYYLLFLGFFHANAQSDLIRSIEKHCQAMHQNRNFNGNILVAQSGKIIFQKSYGYADLETKTPLSNNSIFNIASISKEFTATAIMLCKEEGKLSLDDSLRHFFPELPYSNVTIRHMLQHTSGIPSTEFLFKEWTNNEDMKMKDVLPLLVNKKPPLLNLPGAEFRYSNIPYMLLALIIEKVTHQSYAQFLQQRIFAPLQMNATAVINKMQQKATQNYIYDYLSDSAQQKSYFLPSMRNDWKKAMHISTLYGAGNIFSTTGDLVKWQLALNNNRLLQPSTYQEMISAPVRAGAAGIQNYGYGLSINYLNQDTMIFHNGGTLGFSTTLRYLKNKDIIIISLANTNRTNDPSEGIVALLNGETLLPPHPLREKKLIRTQLEKFCGTYEAGGRQFQIELIGDTLYRKTTGAPLLRLIPSSSDRLFYSDESDRELVFSQKNKDIIYLLKADGLAVPIKKVTHHD